LSSQPEHAVLPGETRDVRRNIGILLRIAFHAVVDAVAAGHTEAGFDDIRPAHTAVFQHIKAEGSRLSELAAAAQMTNQSMSYLVDYLERQGYLERGPDPTDRRATLISLTERGWSQVRTALQTLAHVEEDWGRLLGTRKVAQLRSLLEELVAALEAEAPTRGRPGGTGS
jgi:DNA-binding MarR family transcriptional regulator